jgi:nucleoside-diphosphate-sugar epimerase
MIEFKDQSVIVTGAGRGLGRLYALELARRGASVVVNDLGGATRGGGADGKIADAVVDEIRQAGGVAVASYDSVAVPEGGEAIVRTAMGAFGRLDSVISNAGIVNTAPFEDLTVQQWRDMLAVHLDGAFYLAQPAFRIMKAQGYGRFVFTSSSAAMFGADHHAHYEVGGRKEILELPMMRLLEPELVVPMVVYLASRACDISHQDFSAAAGRYARVFTALGKGWLSDVGSKPTADDIATHIKSIGATSDFLVPFSTHDETIEICGRRGVNFDLGRQQ